MIKLSRKAHKWLMACVGVQCLFWAITGVYMVVINIHFIHGEHLKKDSLLSLSQVTYPVAEITAQFEHVHALEVTDLMGQAVYKVKDKNGWHLFDAGSGAKLAPLDEAKIKAIALYHQSAGLLIASVNLIKTTQNMPAEVSSRHLPFWQVTFERFDNPTFYIQAQSGQIVTVRHLYWRGFDWMWRFHIMDYDDGENVHNVLLLVFSLIAIFASLCGVVLTYQRIFNTKGASA